MDNKNDLILKLAQMLQTNGSKSLINKMPDKNFVYQAKNKNGDNFSQASELKNYLNNRLILAGVDTINARLFLLIPYSNNQWKVFVVDGNDDVYVQLDDYCGEIIERMNGQTPVYCTETFVVSK